MPEQVAALTPLVHPIEETQTLLGGVSRWTICRLLKNGELVPRKIGSRMMVTRASIEAFVRRRDHSTKEPESARKRSAS